MAIISTLSLEQNILLNGLERPEVRQQVIDASYGFNDIQFMVNKTSRGYKSVRSDLIQVPYRGNLAIGNNTAGAPSLSGTNLIITIPSSETRLRLGDVLMDTNTRVQGIISNIAGTLVTLEPAGTTFSASTHFLNGTWFNVQSRVSGNGTSSGTQSLSVTFSYDQACLAKKRDQFDAQILDRLKTEVTFPAGQANGNWFTSQQAELMQRMMRFRENDIVFSDYVYGQSSVIDNSTVNRTGGIRWTTKNNPRSTYSGITWTPSYADLEDVVYTFKQKKAQMGQEVRVIDLYVGADMLQTIQDRNASVTNLLYAGTENTFNVKAGEGNNSYMTTVAGVKCVIHEYAPFNNRGQYGTATSAYTGRPLMESTVMIIDWSGAQSVNGGGTIPTVQPYQFEGISPMQMSTNPGIDPFGQFGREMGKIAYNDLDAQSWYMYCYEGFYIIPENVAFFELLG